MERGVWCRLVTTKPGCPAAGGPQAARLRALITTRRSRAYVCALAGVEVEVRRPLTRHTLGAGCHHDVLGGSQQHYVLGHEGRLLRAMRRVVGRVEVDRDASRPVAQPAAMPLDDRRRQLAPEPIERAAAGTVLEPRDRAATPADLRPPGRARAAACRSGRRRADPNRCYRDGRRRCRTPAGRPGPRACAGPSPVPAGQSDTGRTP